MLFSIESQFPGGFFFIFAFWYAAALALNDNGCESDRGDTRKDGSLAPTAVIPTFNRVNDAKDVSSIQAAAVDHKMATLASAGNPIKYMPTRPSGLAGIPISNHHTSVDTRPFLAGATIYTS